MAHVDAARGNRENLEKVFNLSQPWEQEQGSQYYQRQRQRLAVCADAAALPVGAVIAAFAALSPNNAEKTNYMALETCIKIVSGELPETAKVISYGTNKDKALRMLRGADIDATLRGQKVYSFYRNTLDPNDDEFITVDGHMLGAWMGKRVLLRRFGEIGKGEYRIICEHFREAARNQGVLTTTFQATCWLTWKRVNRILYAAYPQLTFEWPETEEAYAS